MLKMTLVTVGFIFTSQVNANQQDGLQLAKKVYNRKTPKNSYYVSEMRLESKNGSVEKRDFYNYTLKSENSTAHSLVRFTYPEDISGTGLLTSTENGKTKEQSIYIPELNKTRKITANRKGGRFVGSDFYYEDLQPRSTDQDHFNHLGRVKINGIASFKLVAIPKKSGSSIYSRRILYIEENSLLPIKIEYFNRKSKKPFKVYNVVKMENVSGYWVALESYMEDFKTSHKTWILHKKIDFNKKINSGMFKRSVLENSQLEKTLAGNS